MSPTLRVKQPKIIHRHSKIILVMFGDVKNEDSGLYTLLLSWSGSWKCLKLEVRKNYKEKKMSVNIGNPYNKGRFNVENTG